MANIIEYPSGFLETDDPAYIPLILLPEVRAVIWKRKPSIATQRAAIHFCERSYKDIFALSSSDDSKIRARGFDERQLMIERYQQKNFPELAAIWKDRLLVKETLQRSLRSAFYLNQLQVQPAQRHTIDCIPHQDRATKTEEEVTRDDLKIIATLAHNKDGTVFIPQEDAGRQTPQKYGGRRFYHHPHTLKNALHTEGQDVSITKTGPFHGSVHMTPYTRGGLRLLSFFISKKSYLDMTGPA